MRLSGKTAIITGAASGIGAGAARSSPSTAPSLILVDQTRAAWRWSDEADPGGIGIDSLCTGDVGDKRTAERAVAMASEAGW